MKILSEKEKQLYDEYHRYYDNRNPGPKLYKELVKRNAGKIKVLALDLEYTLSSDAVTRWPRTDLYAFLEGVKDLFERIVIFTAVREDLFREVATQFVKEKVAPAWFVDIEYIEWPRHGYKDLSFIPEIEPHEVLLLDDYKLYVYPEQLFQWIPIRQYNSTNYHHDKELNKTLGILELIQQNKVTQKRIIDYLIHYVDREGSGIKKLWLYGPLTKGDDNSDAVIKIALEIDTVSEAQQKCHSWSRSLAELSFLDIENYFWIPVEFVNYDDSQDSIEIRNSWERFFAVFNRHPDRTEIDFPDLTGCTGTSIKKDDDGLFESTLLYARKHARETLERWLTTAKPDDIENMRSKEELERTYSTVHEIWEQLPWRSHDHLR